MTLIRGVVGFHADMTLLSEKSKNFYYLTIGRNIENVEQNGICLSIQIPRRPVLSIQTSRFELVSTA